MLIFWEFNFIYLKFGKNFIFLIKDDNELVKVYISFRGIMVMLKLKYFDRVIRVKEKDGGDFYNLFIIF